MGIEAAELISRPAGQGIMNIGINPQQDLLAVTHRSGVKSAGVDDRRSRLITTEYDHQITDHRRFAFLVEVNDATLTEPAERQFNHADSAVDDT